MSSSSRPTEVYAGFTGDILEIFPPNFQTNSYVLLYLIEQFCGYLNEKCKNNYGCTMDRNCQTLLHVHQADATCALTRWQHFSACRHLESM